MFGASVTSRGATPVYSELPEPVPQEGESLIRVEAAALSNLVRAQASGDHYSSHSTHPFTPGNDGVGLRDDGKRVYFLSPRMPFGSMAQLSVVSRQNTIILPEVLDSATAAAMGNPGLATWGALLGRARLNAGEVILVNGATGLTGRAAIQVARKLGASKIIATGRSGPALEQLREQGVDIVQSVSLPEKELTREFTSILDREKIDIVLDYLWGQSATCLLRALSGHVDSTKSPRVRFVQIGSISGKEITLPASILRSSGVELLGSGLGSLGSEEIVAYLKQMYDSWSPGDVQTEIAEEPLQHVAAAWQKDTGGKRLVFRPA